MEKMFNDSIEIMRDLLTKDGSKKRVPSKSALDSGKILWSLGDDTATDILSIFPFTWNNYEAMILLSYSKSWSESTKEVLSTAACDVLWGQYLAMRPAKISLVDINGGVIRIDFKLSDNLKAKGVKDYYILNQNVFDSDIAVTVYEDDSETMYLVGYDVDGKPYKKEAHLVGDTITPIE